MDIAALDNFDCLLQLLSMITNRTTIDRESIESAASVFERLVPNSKDRLITVEYLSRLIGEADNVDNSFWGVTLFQDIIVLSVGAVYFFRLSSEYIELLLEESVLEYDLKKRLHQILKDCNEKEYWQAPQLKNNKNIDKIWARIPFDEISLLEENSNNLLKSQISLMDRASDAVLHHTVKKSFSHGIIKYLTKNGLQLD